MKNKKKVNNKEPLNLFNGIRINPKVTIVNKISNGSVCLTTKSSTVIGLIIDKIPITRKILAIFEPITLPTAISL